MKWRYFYVRYTTATATVQKLEEDINSLREHLRVKEVDCEALITEKKDRIYRPEPRLKDSLSRFDFFSFYFAPESWYI